MSHDARTICLSGFQCIYISRAGRALPEARELLADMRSRCARCVMCGFHWSGNSPSQVPWGAPLWTGCELGRRGALVDRWPRQRRRRRPHAHAGHRGASRRRGHHPLLRIINRQRPQRRRRQCAVRLHPHRHHHRAKLMASGRAALPLATNPTGPSSDPEQRSGRCPRPIALRG